MLVILHAHPIRGELHIQHKVNREVATILGLVHGLCHIA